MKQILTFCACLLAAWPLVAGKRVQMESTNLATKGVEQQELLLDATRFRVNAGNSSMIFLTDGGRNRMLVLDKSRNEYMEMDQQTMDQMGSAMQGIAAQMEAAMKGMPPEQRAMMEQMMKGKMPPGAGAAPARASYQSKGKGKANGFNCTNFEGTRAGQKIAEVCAADASELKLAASDFEVFRKMQEFMSGMMQALASLPMAQANNNAMVDEAGVTGFPVQRTTFQNGQAVRREELKSVTDASFTDADFSVGNAKRAEMPSMGGPGGPFGPGKGKGR